MGLTLLTALSFAVIYRITINFTGLPYSPDLHKPGSDKFLKTNILIEEQIEQLLRSNSNAKVKASVLSYRYQQVLGTIVTIDLYSTGDDPGIKRIIQTAAQRGSIGVLTVGYDGFEFHTLKGTPDRCSPLEFECKNGRCINTDLRCNGNDDCGDRSDEASDYALCASYLPTITVTKSKFEIRAGGTVELSAIIQKLPIEHQVLWSHNGEILAQGGLVMQNKSKFEAHRSGEEFFLKIRNLTSDDSGLYNILINHLGLNATIHVRVITEVSDATKQKCLDGQMACQSGHCLPKSLFCDGHVHCPDGDDELNCPVIKQKSQLDHHLSARPTVSCPDGSLPEYSLHGSTYCWSHSVCPSYTACIESQCCKTALLHSLRKCPSSQWECSNGSCLNFALRCDGVKQCTDGSDELHCGNEKRSVESKCKIGDYICDSGECIALSKRCDRHYDCRDGTDETTCEYFIAATSHRSSSSFSSNKLNADNTVQDDNHPYLTNDSRVKSEKRYLELSQRQEEAVEIPFDIECSDQEFRCPYLPHTVCVHYDKLCDGNDDCGDGSDEMKCESESEEETLKCKPNMYRCGNGQCIAEALKCDHKYDCQDGTDESTCDYFKAALSRHHDNYGNDIRETNNANTEKEKHNAESERRKAEEERRHEKEKRLRIEEERRRLIEERRRLEESRRREEETRRQNEDERRQAERIRLEDERRRNENSNRSETQRLNTKQKAEEKQKNEFVKTEGEDERLKAENRRKTFESRRLGEERRDEEEDRRRAEAIRGLNSESIDTTVVRINDDNDVQYGEEGAGEVEDDKCDEHEFMCGDGECIDRRRVCDTRIDCLDGLDESQCHVAQPSLPSSAAGPYQTPSQTDHSNGNAQQSTDSDSEPQRIPAVSSGG